MKRRNLAMMILALALVAEPLLAQPRRGGGRRGGGDEPRPEGRSDAGSDTKIKPYDEIIQEDAKTQKGLFTVHQQDGKVFYEIPPAALDRDMLWVVQLAKTQAGFGYGGTGVGNRVVRWERRDDNILLRDVKYTIRADTDDSVKNAVEATSVAPIIKSFAVQAWGKDQAAVIEVTDVFTSDMKEFSPSRSLSGASGMDSSRTFIEGTKVFPENINVSVLATFKLSSSSPTAGRQGPTRRRSGPRRDPTQSAVTVELHHSMVLLPEKPMAPREHDSRVGFFGVSFEDYGSEEQAVENVRYITRWRLEKKEPEADLSEPVKPIVFYIGRGVPDKWKPFMKKGIEMWQPAFEKAGFKNAIVGEFAPSERENPDWDAEDARVSSIRWLPSTTENAMGPHVHDPRTGEILEADIIFYHNVLKLCRDWYFVQASPNDERAQQLPLPDDLLGELLAYVVAHEVGHSLGFPHNMKASSSYSIEQLRNADFTAKNGTEASIMDYGRFNYVAQPGDGATLIPKIGPYDKFAVQWGYSQYADEKAEQEGLSGLVALQRDNAMLRFGDPNPSEDPTQQTEDLGANPLGATELGLKNLERVAGYLIQATCKAGENYDLLENMYGQLVGQRSRELGHVANVVGGVVRDNVWYGDGERQYELVGADRQREAVAFLNKHAFQVPDYLVRNDILSRLEASGAADRILGGQKRVLSALMSPSRIKRMSEYEARAENVYTPAELCSDIRDGIWSELQELPVRVDLYRRNLQRAHIEQLVTTLKSGEAESDLPALARGELQTIGSLVSRSIGRGIQDTMTRHHLDDIVARIEKAFHPGAGDATPTETSSPFGGGILEFERN